MPPRCIRFMFCQSAFSGMIGILVQAQVLILWGFFDAWSKFLSTVRDWIGSIVGTLILKVKNSQKMHFVLTPTCIKKWGPKTGSFGAEWGRRGSVWAHTLGKRSHGIQEGF